MKAADECFSSLENTWVSHSQSTLYTFINYEFAESDLQHTHRPCCITRRGECQESVSFTQGEVFKAACLHPARAQNINCRTENRIRTGQPSGRKDGSGDGRVTDLHIHISLQSSVEWDSVAQPCCFERWLEKGNVVSRGTLLRASPYGPVVSVWLMQLLMKIRGTVGGIWWPLNVDVWR